MHNRSSLSLSFAKKAGLAVAGVVAVAIPVILGVTNAPRLRAQAQSNLRFGVDSVRRVEIPTINGIGTSGPHSASYHGAQLRPLVSDAVGGRAIAAQIRFEGPPTGAGDPPITVEKRPEAYKGTVSVPERNAEYAFVSLWGYESGTSLPVWADTKDYCESPSWGNFGQTQFGQIHFSSIRDIDFMEPTKGEVEAIRGCDNTKSDYGQNGGYYDLRKAKITMRDGQKRTVFLYTAGAFAKTAENDRFFLSDTRLVSRLSLK